MSNPGHTYILDKYDMQTNVGNIIFKGTRAHLSVTNQMVLILLSNTNSVIYTKLNVFKYCYLILFILIVLRG